ncbi:hypothetical protein RDn1_267 [Candidatus Termititenax dinenymphae]|uniref:Uncharacterized protein n=1 Tax=Candidatus Termititenax dinenymphae TaxID=2218523 RepID=A0A388TJX3_9BACT|nr:hypothetical protein RDn1_267 [Candidatus Termititenax dinenymphae]
MVDTQIKGEEEEIKAVPPEDQHPAEVMAAPDELEEVDLHELQIKLEKVRSYVKRTEMRINANEMHLQRLREKQQAVEDKRLGISLVPKKTKTENKV